MSVWVGAVLRDDFINTFKIELTVHKALNYDQAIKAKKKSRDGSMQRFYQKMPPKIR